MHSEASLFKCLESFDKKEERNGKKKKERKKAAGRLLVGRINYCH